MTAAHEVRAERHPDRPGSRWLCTCGWNTPWALYTNPHAGPAALLHALRANRQAYPQGNVEPEAGPR